MMAFIGGLCIQGRDRASSSLSSRSVRRSVEVTEKPVSVSLVPLGCPKNTVDAEVMLGDLEQQGISVLDDESSADVIIVNTCGFIEDAKRESIEAILAAAELKQGSTTKGIVVTGCLAQRYASQLAEELPEVDAVVGFEGYKSLGEKVRKIALNGKKKSRSTVEVGKATVPFRPEWGRRRLAPRHTAYMRVAEGCDHACSFCAIPSFRGKFR
mmetsp:Transcript_22463/g.90089  ORF Transcript_22463/g.90089 Transcript_22463/m.90089 type:complete len:212 (+) Transcript_22463:55-690(+)